MEILYILLVLLLVTRAFGEVAARLGQPPLVGELIAGIVLGLVVRRFSGTFPILAGLPNDDVFRSITDLGIFFLMLLAGVEMRPRELAETSVKAVFVAIGGMLVPFAAGFAAGWSIVPDSSYRVAQCIFIATALSITAVPVVVRALKDIGQQDTPMGRMIISAAVFDDIFSLVLLAILTAVIRTGEFPDVAHLFGLILNILVFFAVSLFVGLFVFPRVGRLVIRLKAGELEFSGLLVAAMAYAVLAEALQLHFIVGAFLAGVFFGRQTMGDEPYNDVKAKVSGLTTGFLGPVFFASIGLHLDLSALTSIPGLLLLFIVLALVAKLIGAGIPAYALGLPWREATGVGVGMSARGAVELIIADVAMRAGLFQHPSPAPPEVEHLFSVIVIVAIATTLFAPLLLQALFPQDRLREA